MAIGLFVAPETPGNTGVCVFDHILDAADTANGGSFTFSAFLTGALLNSLPGIVFQIVLIPIFVMILDNPKVLNLRD